MVDQLPDELLLEIVNYFRCILSHKPQSTAFKHRWMEMVRQRDNRARQLVLHALCITSHRLRRIATPILYASFVSTAASYSFKPLQLFHRTICNPDPVSGLKIHPAQCLLYIENRLSDYLGNSLSKDTEADDALPMVTQYFQLLADIAKRAPNLRHLNVVSLEAGEVSFWRHILPDHTNQSATAVANHGFQKLESLSFQVHTKGYELDSYAASFRHIFSAMTAMPMLTDLRASGVMTSNHSLSLPGTFDRLQCVEITECVLDLEEVSEILGACNELRHITCEWAFYDCEEGSPSQLYAGLLRHAKTLETLRLDMSEVRMATTQHIGSLQPFASLKELSLCERALGIPRPILYFPEQVLDFRISAPLPQNLETFTVFVYREVRPVYDARPDDIVALWDLAEDLTQTQSDLKIIRFKGDCQVILPYLNAPCLVQAFQDAGVHFDLNDNSEFWG